MTFSLEELYRVVKNRKTFFNLYFLTLKRWQFLTFNTSNMLYIVYTTFICNTQVNWEFQNMLLLLLPYNYQIIDFLNVKPINDSLQSQKYNLQLSKLWKHLKIVKMCTPECQYSIFKALVVRKTLLVSNLKSCIKLTMLWLLKLIKSRKYGKLWKYVSLKIENTKLKIKNTFCLF